MMIGPQIDEMPKKFRATVGKKIFWRAELPNKTVQESTVCAHELRARRFKYLKFGFIHSNPSRVTCPRKVPPASIRVRPIAGTDEMKKKRFTEEQIIGILREQEAGAKVADLARKYAVSEATRYNWKAKFGGMDASEAKRLKALEDENAKLKRLLADQMLEAAALRELLGKNGRARREARRRRAPSGRHGPVGASGL